MTGTKDASHKKGAKQHAPGPWWVDNCTLLGRWVRAAEDLVAEVYSSDNTDESRLANASLISAAPDLLEAVRGYQSAAKVVKDTLESFHQGVAHPQQHFLAVEALRKASKKARAAIAKAEGT